MARRQPGPAFIVAPSADVKPRNDITGTVTELRTRVAASQALGLLHTSGRDVWVVTTGAALHPEQTVPAAQIQAVYIRQNYHDLRDRVKALTLPRHSYDEVDAIAGLIAAETNVSDVPVYVVTNRLHGYRMCTGLRRLHGINAIPVDSGERLKSPLIELVLDILTTISPDARLFGIRKRLDAMRPMTNGETD